jgi:hypothetical protein
MAFTTALGNNNFNGQDLGGGYRLWIHRSAIDDKTVIAISDQNGKQVARRDLEEQDLFNSVDPAKLILTKVNEVVLEVEKKYGINVVPNGATVSDTLQGDGKRRTWELSGPALSIERITIKRWGMGSDEEMSWGPEGIGGTFTFFWDGGRQIRHNKSQPPLKQGEWAHVWYRTENVAKPEPPPTPKPKRAYRFDI